MKEISRRDFLKGAAVGAIGVAAVGIAGCGSTATTATATPESVEATALVEETWDAEYDVVVMGFGGAGGSAAISVADFGAKVLMLEKAPGGWAGGNTRLSGQMVLTPTDVEAAVNYFVSISAGFDYNEDLFRITCEEMSQNGDWLRSIGATDDDLATEMVYSEWPEYSDSSAMHCYVVGGYFSGMSFSIIKNAVESRSDMIDVWYESPATRLIQNVDDGTIIGVIAEHEGENVRIKANKGVVMACGGFENNQEMIQNYLQVVRKNLCKVRSPGIHNQRATGTLSPK